ncbi:MAG: LURP-one-related family protein [Oscillospiraceae bacterium]|nr:LURP-one-related family protein [Oscillospiraceae bacterium]
MGTFSKFHRFREAGQDANVHNLERFGAPARSLFTSTKVLTLHHKITITDAEENVVYRAESKFFSLRDKTDIFDAADNLVAHIERKIFTIRQRHYVSMADGTSFELSNELLHLIKAITNIEGLGWQLRGNILGLGFELYDQNDQIIAVIAQKMFSLHDKYCIDIYKPEYEKTVVAILVTLQHMIRDRENASSGSSSSSSSD